MFAYLDEQMRHPAWAAVVASIVPTLASIICVYLTYSYGSMSQNRQAQLETIARFDQSSNHIVDVGSRFLSALNEHKDKELSESRSAISALAGKQLLETGTLKKLFNDDAAISEYEDAVQDFSATAQHTKSALDIKPWAESFGRVVDSRAKMTKNLYRRVGVDVGLESDG